MRVLIHNGLKYAVVDIEDGVDKISQQEMRNSPILGVSDLKPDEDQYDEEYQLNYNTTFFKRKSK